MTVPLLCFKYVWQFLYYSQSLDICHTIDITLSLLVIGEKQRSSICKASSQFMYSFHGIIYVFTIISLKRLLMFWHLINRSKIVCLVPSMQHIDSMFLMKIYCYTDIQSACLVYFLQWLDSFKAVSRLPRGVPSPWRRRVRALWQFNTLVVMITMTYCFINVRSELVSALNYWLRQVMCTSVNIYNLKYFSFRCKFIITNVCFISTAVVNLGRKQALSLGLEENIAVLLQWKK